MSEQTSEDPKGSDLELGDETTIDVGSAAPPLAGPATDAHFRYFGDYEILREIAAEAWASSLRPDRRRSTAGSR